MKKLTAAVAALAMLFSSVFAASLSDIGGHWAEEQINAAYENKTINGDEDGKFRPDDGISRGEFLKMITAFLAGNFNIEIPEVENAEHWAQKYYNFAITTYLQGMESVKIDGISPGIFDKKNYDEPLERWEMAYIIDSALSAVYGIHSDEGDFSNIADIKEVEENLSQVSSSVKSMISLGIMAGDENGYFLPHFVGTRAEAVVVLSRVSVLTDKIHKYVDSIQQQQQQALKEQEDALKKTNITYEKIPTGHPVVEFTLANGGKFEITLYPEYAPQTCANFLELVSKHFYDGLTFHRVIDGFMAQGGDPNGNGTGGSGSTIFGEFASNGFSQNTLKHEKGVVSMARSQLANSASSQFFICYDDASYLDGQYAAFGKVTKGMNIVENFLMTEMQDNGYGEISSPKKPIKITKAVVKKKQ